MAEVSFAEASRLFPGNPPVRAVDKLSLDIADGEFLVLVGPSGSGKSTALRMLAGLEDIDEGAITIGGKDVTGVSPKNRDIAMVFQSYALYPHMTVAENMGFALKIKRISKAEIAERVAEAARLLDLTDYLDRKPKALSGGQRQRVAMGRAIVREPAVFLMDEPLSNLDAKLRVETRANITALQSRLGTTTVYVTHDQVEAMTMGHRVAVLKNGVLQQCDTPKTLYASPANVFVAGFIGSPAMNLTTVPLSDDGAKLDGLTVPVARDLLSGEAANLREVTVGIRPEGLRHASEGEPALEMKVELVEVLGSDAYVYGQVDVGGKHERFIVRTEADRTPSFGETMRVALRHADAAHTFNPETGLRLSA